MCSHSINADANSKIDSDRKSSRPARFRYLALVSAAFLWCLGHGLTTFAADYKTADEAYQAGALLLNRNEDAKSQAPLEQALKMAPNDAYKVNVYRALTRPYYLLPQPDKMFEAIEFILDKSASAAERSLARSTLISYLQPRGKTDVAIKRYEDLLKKDPGNKTALYILSEVYDKLRKNPKRSSELGEKLAEVMKKEGGTLDVNQAAQLAAQYVKAGKFKEGAELFESIAEKDPKLSAWHWKEAAAAWLKLNNNDKALAAAKASSAGPPESRGDLLAHFWNRQLGDIYLKLGEPKLAIPHYEQAIEKTNIEGYVKDCKASLAEAQAKAGTPTTTKSSTGGSGKTTGKTSNAGQTAKGGIVDLNAASIDDLTAVDGVSEDLAVQIIDRRKKKPFNSVSELIEFDGVDKNLLAKLRKAFTIGEKK